MNTYDPGLSRLALLTALALSACLPAAVPDTNEASGTEAPPAEPANTAPAKPPTELESVNLAGPPMEVGSTYTYVDGTTLVAVPAGAFIMGRNSSDNPEHEVTLSDFWIYSTKATNSQYQLCVGAGECDPPDLENNPNYMKFENLNKPVTGVDWSQAQAYCSFVHGRLPTEAEWEKTARGPEGNIYPWGDGSPICDLLNFNLCVGQTTIVTDYPQGKSYYDALDMAGNAYEWVADWYDPFYYRSGPAQDPPGPVVGEKRSVRSSAYNSSPERTPSAVRWALAPSLTSHDLGFRCVVDDPTYFAPMCEQLAYQGFGPGSSGNPIQSPNYNCPDLDIITAPQKCDSNSTYVTFKYPENFYPPIVLADGGCSLISNPPNPVYECNAPTDVSLQGICQFTGGLTPATCAPHYNFDVGTGKCIWDGTGSLRA